MRVHDGELSGTRPAGGCRALIGGLGLPGMRDLDFGRQVVRYLELLDWPEGVVVEDLSCAAHLALHRIQELHPATVVLIGAAVRDGRSAGSVHHYRLDPGPPPPQLVHDGLAAAASGMADLDHTLAVVRHWGALPADSTVIEVQPADCSFGAGFSEELGDRIEEVRTLVQGAIGTAMERVSLEELATDRPHPGSEQAEPEPPDGGLEQMADRARLHRWLRHIEPYHRSPLISRSEAPCPVHLATRSRAFGVGLGTGGDWFDVIPRPGGGAAVLVGDAAGRGLEGAAVMSELRAAARAYALLEDQSPARLVHRLDQLVRTSGSGAGSALTCVQVEPRSGRVRMAAAGACPLLVASGQGDASFAGTPGPALGADQPVGGEEELELHEGETLFLFTAGLARAGRRSLDDGYEWLRVAATRVRGSLDAACDFVFDSCLDRRRDDDAMLVALRLDPMAVASRSKVVVPSTAE